MEVVLDMDCMNNIDKEIISLEEKLKNLKEQKNRIDNKNLFTSDCQEGDMKIVVYSHCETEEEKKFNTFKEMFDYISKKMKKNDIFAFDYYQNKEWMNKEFDNLNEINQAKIIEIIASLDVYSVYTMEIGICNKKNQWKYSIWIETPVLIKYKDVIENRHFYTEDEYNKIINETKNWRLF